MNRRRTAAADRIADGHDDFPRPKEILFSETGMHLDGEEIDLDLKRNAVRLPADYRAAMAAPWFSRIPARTPGQEQRRKRDLLIYWAASRGGFSQRFLAEACDLPRSCIGEIVQAMKDLECSP